MENVIQKKMQENRPEAKQQKSVNAIINSMLDGEGLRKRFDELLGKRAPQFVSSLVSLINADVNLLAAFRDAPMTVIQSALKAATFDLPIEPSLGYAYIVPFKNWVKNEDGTKTRRTEAVFVLGYKGMEQLCLRTGAYSRVPDAVDVREGELVSYDRLTGDCEFKWEEDEEKREKLPVIGYAGYFRLKNGAEKTIYMTVNQIKAHEQKNRKGEFMSKGWRENFDGMARKTVIRRLAGKYGLMSIQYQDGDKDTVNLANAIMDDAPQSETIPAEYADLEPDPETGEAIQKDAQKEAEAK